MTPEVTEELRQLDALDRDIERGIAAFDASLGIEASAGYSGDVPVRRTWNTGTKFPGGFGETLLLTPDYWTLRARSSQLFRTNLYARGIIRRYITNVINTGLHLECTPDESVLGFAEDSLSDWAELVENRFQIWERFPWLCDFRERESFGELQAAAEMEALIAGDVLVVLRQDARTGLPRVQLVNGDAVQTPAEVPKNGNRIMHGVELDKFGRHVAYWIRQEDEGSPFRWVSKRMPAWGEKSGRRIAWLVYGTEKRLDDVRGEPLLALILQSLREIDRYRDSTQRKAVINSMLAMFIAKGEDKPGTMPLTGGAVRRGVVTQTDQAGGTRKFSTVEHIPGLVLDELQHGEEPKAFQTQGTIENFGTFEEAIVQSVAWALETPPEILRLAFSNNYSASQAAINEYKMFLNRVRTWFGASFCAPIYLEWLLSEVLSGRIVAAGLLEAWRSSNGYDVYGAWTLSEWAGQIKPAVDLSKLVAGYTAMVEEGFITRDRAARELTGMKYSKVAKRLRLENEQLREANKVLEPPAPIVAPPGSDAAGDDAEDSPDEGEDSEGEKEAA